jgi:hypothetical protein
MSDISYEDESEYFENREKKIIFLASNIKKMPTDIQYLIYSFCLGCLENVYRQKYIIRTESIPKSFKCFLMIRLKWCLCNEALICAAKYKSLHYIVILQCYIFKYNMKNIIISCLPNAFELANIKLLGVLLNNYKKCILENIEIIVDNKKCKESLYLAMYRHKLGMVGYSDYDIECTFNYAHEFKIDISNLGEGVDQSKLNIRRELYP